jgi:hypothetical protein
MTDDRLDIMARLFGAGLAVFVLLLAFIGYAFGQEFPKNGEFLIQENAPKQENRCDHINNSFARFDAIRLTPMSTVLNLEPIEGGHKLETRTDAKYVTKYTAFTLTKGTAWDAKEIKRGKLVFVLYSICDGHVYAVTLVRPDQIIK